jgi:hypothetical protein
MTKLDNYVWVTPKTSIAALSASLKGYVEHYSLPEVYLIHITLNIVV